MYPEIFVVLGS